MAKDPGSIPGGSTVKPQLDSVLAGASSRSWDLEKGAGPALVQFFAALFLGLAGVETVCPVNLPLYPWARLARLLLFWRGRNACVCLVFEVLLTTHGVETPLGIGDGAVRPAC